MRFRLLVSCTGSAPWWEDYEKDAVTTIEEAREWARTTTDRFNRTLRPNELKRTLLAVKAVRRARGEDRRRRDHEWEKTSLTTQRDGSGLLYDAYRCRTCTITARRYGVGAVVRDRRYSARVYERCDTAHAHLVKRRKA